MNIEACYNKMGADYAEVKSRLPSDAFIKRFALKFLDDPTFALLERASLRKTWMKPSAPHTR